MTTYSPPKSTSSSSSSFRHPSLFDSPTKHGMHNTFATFTPTEQRFRWQNATTPSDALYKLPTSIGTGPKKSFGTSTREDWDVSKKRTNACAGPGSYEAIDSCGRKQPSSLCRSASVAAFENAPRAPLQNDATPSPGPIYDLPVAIGTTSSTKFGTSKRPPLSGKIESPGPNIALKGSFQELRPGVSPTFGTERRMRGTVSLNSPGPIYDLKHTGFKTGGQISFSHAKRFT